jgi:hypothetical protein
MVTDSATLPRARYVMTLDEMPPGLAPRRIMPRASSAGRPRVREIAQPSKGMVVNCRIAPTKTPLGICRMRTKSPVVSVAPMPNMAICSSRVTSNGLSSGSRLTAAGGAISPARTAATTHAANP